MGYTSKYKGAEIDALLEKMVHITWEELVALRDKGNLIAGQMYRITDYETMTSKEGSQAAGHPFDIIVTALDNKTLDEKASAIWSARDTDGYFADCNLPAWDVRYCLDNDTNRFDWAVKAGKTISVDMSAMGLEGVVFTNFYDGTIEWMGTMYHKWAGSGYSGYSISMLTETDSPSVGGTCLLILGIEHGGGESFGEVLISAVANIEVSGKGVIYRLIDEYENEAPYDFKNIKFLRKVSGYEIDETNGTDTYLYTFDSMGQMDISLNGIAISNKIGERSWNVVIALGSGGGSAYNKIGSACLNITISGFYIEIGDACSSINVIDGSSIRIDNGCSAIKLGSNCEEVEFKGRCHNVELGGSWKVASLFSVVNIKFLESKENPVPAPLSAMIINVRVNNASNAIFYGGNFNNVHIDEIYGSDSSHIKELTLTGKGYRIVCKDSNGVDKIVNIGDLVQ